MGDLNGAPIRDLLTKDGYDRPCRTQHIAKAHTHVRATQCLRLILDIPLGDPFGRPHDRRWPDGLIGRNQYEPFHVLARARINHRACPTNIVLRRLRRVVLHHGDMLVRRSVEHQRRCVCSEHLLDPVGVTHVGNRRDQGDVRMADPKLTVDCPQGTFGLFDQHQLAGREPHQLPAQLGTDGSSRAGHQHRLAFDQASNRRGVEFNRIPSQQVLDLYRAQPRQIDLAPKDLIHARNDPCLDPGATARLGESTHDAASRVGDTDDRLVNRMVGNDALQIGGCPQNLQPVHHLALLRRIVVNETDRVELKVGSRLNLPRNDSSGTPRPDQQNPSLASRSGAVIPKALGAAFFDLHSSQRPHAHDAQDRQRQVSSNHAHRHQYRQRLAPQRLHFGKNES